MAAAASVRGTAATTASPSRVARSPSTDRALARGVTDRRRRSPEAVRSETLPSVITLPLLKMATRSQTRWTS